MTDIALALTANADTAAEAQQDFSLVITMAADANGRYADHTITYAQNISIAESFAPGWTISPTSVSVEVGDTVDFTIRPNTAPSADLTVTPSVATASAAFATVTSGALMFSATDYSTPKTVTVRGDSVGTASINFTLLGLYIPGPAPVQVTVTKALPDHVFTLSSPAASIDEDDTQAGADTTFTMARAGQGGAAAPTLSGAGITVTWSVSHGGTVNADFTAATQSGGTVTFTGDELSETFDVGIIGDNINEPGETFTLQFSIASGAHTTSATDNGGATLPGNHTVTINDDDDFELSFTAAMATVSEAETAANTPRTVRLTVDLGAVASRNVGTTFAGHSAAAVTARGNANEVVATAGARNNAGEISPANADVYLSGVSRQQTASTVGYLTIRPGESSGWMDIAIVDDDVNESTEVYALSIGVSSGNYRAVGIASGAATLTVNSAQVPVAIFAITDDDDITYAIARAGGSTASVAERASVDFTITLSGASATASPSRWT